MLALIALALAAATASKPAPTPPNPDSTLQIRSYGEPAEDLRELLAPFLARFNFREARRYATGSPNYVESEFNNTDGDRVFTLGGPNCLMVGYFATRNPPRGVSLLPAERARRFTEQLKQFLAGLPSPQPRGIETHWSWGTWC